MKMTTNQPYLLRAIHQWILDNDLTPHILVNADSDQVDVPEQFVQDGQIVLNIAPNAISGVLMDNEAVSFTARFSGVAQTIYVPVHAIKAIYASENGQGMVFPDEAPEEFEDDEQFTIVDPDSEIEEQQSTESEPSKKKPLFLKVIK